MNLREAAQQATPREQLLKELMDSRVPKTEREHAAAREIERLSAALAEATIKDNLTVEPVAWMWDYKRLDGHVEIKIAFAHRYKGFPGDLAYVLEGKDATPLYTAPPKRKPLTDEEIHDCFQQKHKDKVIERRMIARAIERAHNIGESK